MRRWILLSMFLAACSAQPQPAPDHPNAAQPPLLSGTLELDDAVKSQADPLAVIFVIARNSQGQIVAVKKLFPPFQYPVAFYLGQEVTMFQGTELSGKLQVTARLDKDGNANPAQTGDILGKGDPSGFSPGSRDVKIRLNEVVK